MPVYDSREKKTQILPFIILSNIFPLIGVMYYDMSFFMVFYLYWAETFIITFFDWLKMGKANKAAEPDPHFTINGKPLTYNQVNNKKFMRRSYLFIRIFMLLFYFIFIVVFVGYMPMIHAENKIKYTVSIIDIILFQNQWMRLSLLVFFILHIVQYALWIQAKEYEQTSLRNLGSPFDGRMVIMHLVIVLGTFLSMLVGNKLFPDNPNAGQLSIAFLFVSLKTLLDIISYKNEQKKTHTILTTYNTLIKK